MSILSLKTTRPSPSRSRYHVPSLVEARRGPGCLNQTLELFGDDKRPYGPLSWHKNTNWTYIIDGYA